MRSSQDFIRVIELVPVMIVHTHTDWLSYNTKGEPENAVAQPGDFELLLQPFCGNYKGNLQ